MYHTHCFLQNVCCRWFGEQCVLGHFSFLDIWPIVSQMKVFHSQLPSVKHYSELWSYRKCADSRPCHPEDGGVLKKTIKYLSLLCCHGFLACELKINSAWRWGPRHTFQTLTGNLRSTHGVRCWVWLCQSGSSFLDMSVAHQHPRGPNIFNVFFFSFYSPIQNCLMMSIIKTRFPVVQWFYNIHRYMQSYVKFPLCTSV